MEHTNEPIVAKTDCSTIYRYKIRVFNIRWDFDRGEPKNPQRGETLKRRGLEKEYILEVDIDEDVFDPAEDICGTITNFTGYCIYDADYEVIKTND